MNVIITHFNSPLSFFCKTAQPDGYISPVYNISNYKNEINKVVHGQYVAVFWQKKWTRGVVEKKDKFLIWLIDFGCYFVPCQKTMCVNLSPIHKKLPCNVFEASIHGVVPLELDINFDGLESQISTRWSEGALTRAKEAISKAALIIFVPVAVLNTEHNNIVLGDLHIKTKQGEIVNLIDKLEEWPQVISRNKNAYIQNMSQLYLEHRKHYFGCTITNIPSISVTVTTEEYNAICTKHTKPVTIIENAEVNVETPVETEIPDTDTDSEESSTVDDIELFTPEEIELYSQQYVIMAGKKRNVLEVMKHKLFDMIMCKKYKNHDLKGLGRAVSRGSMYELDNFEDLYFSD